MLIKVDRFSGMSKQVAPRLLADKFATEAINCRFDRGVLQPLMGNRFERSLPFAPKTIFRYSGDHWFTWNKDVDVVRSPIAYDISDRVIFTGDGYPKQTRNDIALGGYSLPNASYRLGVPAPTSVPNAVFSGETSTEQEGLEIDVSYIVTFVTAWGEEGPPSGPSNILTLAETAGAAVTVSLPSIPSGNYNFSRKRIYRSNSGSSATAYQFLADVPAGTSSYRDATASDRLGEVIPSTLWDAPPDDDTTRYPSGQMKGIRMLPNGVAVGFSGNTLVYSEPYMPHAWPYSYPCKDQIVAIEVTSSGVLVTTTDKPYIAIGHDPQAVSLSQLDESRACISKRSMVDMGEYAIYASHDGLVGIENGSTRLLTEGLFTKEQWAEFEPRKIHGYRWGKHYIGTIEGSTEAFMFTPGDADNAFVMLRGQNGVAGYYDGDEGKFYYNNGAALYSFGTDTMPLTYYWKSKEFVSPEPISYSAIQVEADSYPLHIDVIRDGVSTVYTITSAKPQRLRPGRCRTLQFALIGSSTIEKVVIGQSMTEVARG